LPELEPDQEIQEVDQELPQQTAAIAGEAQCTSASRSFLSAFKHRNYRLFFIGQLISLTGTWLQIVAQSWLLLNLVSRAKAELTLGIVSAISSLPILIFSFFAGVVIDRFSKRNIIVVTQISAMLLAFALAALTNWHIVTVFQIAIIGFLLGTVNALDAPARQSFVIEMVGREDLHNAITLNSAMFNGARILGPAVAGFAVAAVGMAGAFFFNGVSFIAVIIGLLLMRVPPAQPKAGTSAWLEFKEGLRFIRYNRMVKALLIMTGAVSICAMPYAVLMPILARYNLHQEAQGFGYLFSAVGLGALAGAFTLSAMGDFNWKGKMLLVGNLTFCVMLILFSTARSMSFALPVLFVAGWGMMINMALTNTLIQVSVPDELRGRVISVYTFMFLGMTPVGSSTAGLLADKVGVEGAIQLGAILSAAVALLLSPRFFHTKQTALSSDQCR